MRPATLRRSFAALVVLAAAGGGTAVAVAQLSGSDAADPLQRPNTVITAVDADQLAAFGVLRGERGAAADLSPAASALIGGGLAGDVGASAALARQAGSTPDGTALYVVPADGWVCLVTGDGGGGCNRTADVVAGYGLLLQRQADAVALEGLVPDGVSTVTVTGAGSSAEVPVVANTWSARVTFEPANVHWTGSDGAMRDVPVWAPPAEPIGPPSG